MTEERKAEDTVQVEYSAEGGETIHEAEVQLSAYVQNHSLCGEPGHCCPTGVHIDVPLEPGGSF